MHDVLILTSEYKVNPNYRRTIILGDRHVDFLSWKQAANLIFFIMVENRNATLFKLCLATVSSMIWQLQTLFSDVKYTIVPNHEQDTVIFMAW